MVEAVKEIVIEAAEPSDPLDAVKVLQEKDLANFRRDEERRFYQTFGIEKLVGRGGDPPMREE